MTTAKDSTSSNSSASTPIAPLEKDTMVSGAQFDDERQPWVQVQVTSHSTEPHDHPSTPQGVSSDVGDWSPNTQLHLDLGGDTHTTR